MSEDLDEPSIPVRLRRPLAAMWISLGLHAAVIALVQVSPPSVSDATGPVIEARLVSDHVAPPTPAATEIEPVLVSSTLLESLPIIDVVEPPPTPAPTTVANPQPLSQPAAPSAPVTLTSSVDLNFYVAREVDVHPRALREIVPDYPVDADREHVSGKVRLQLKLEADGRVIDVTVVGSTPPGRFDDAAVKAFRNASFAPAMKAGRPVRALIVIEVAFDWEGRPL